MRLATLMLLAALSLLGANVATVKNQFLGVVPGKTTSLRLTASSRF